MELEFNQVGHKNSCIENWNKWLALQSVGRLATTLVATISDNIYLFFFCQAQPANPQLGAEIALFSQLWGTTMIHTPYTQPGIVVLPVSSLIITTVGTCS